MLYQLKKQRKGTFDVLRLTVLYSDDTALNIGMRFAPVSDKEAYAAHAEARSIIYNDTKFTPAPLQVGDISYL